MRVINAHAMRAILFASATARLGPIEKATDPDKQATTPAEWIIYRGVKVTSRYRLAHEMKLMRDVV